MSGAALWVNQCLVGVITADSTPDQPSTLVATRLDNVLGRLNRDDPHLASEALEGLGIDVGEPY